MVDSLKSSLPIHVCVNTSNLVFLRQRVYEKNRREVPKLESSGALPLAVRAWLIPGNTTSVIIIVIIIIIIITEQV